MKNSAIKQDGEILIVEGTRYDGSITGSEVIDEIFGYAHMEDVRAHARAAAREKRISKNETMFDKYLPYVVYYGTLSAMSVGAVYLVWLGLKFLVKLFM